MKKQYKSNNGSLFSVVMGMRGNKIEVREEFDWRPPGRKTIVRSEG